MSVFGRTIDNLPKICMSHFRSQYFEEKKTSSSNREGKVNAINAFEKLIFMEL